MSVTAETLGVAPQDDARLVATAAPESMAAEQYRLLLARLDRAPASRPMRTVAISSCARGEGRSLTAANLALTAARDGRETALVECDLRRPSLSQLFDLAPRAGLAEVLEGKAELAQAMARVGALSVLCAGATRDPAAAFRSARLASTVDALRSSHRLIVLDAPPALALADAGRLASMADGVVLVVRAGETPREAVRLAVDTLQDRLVGIVLNGVEEPGYARYLRNEAVGV
ncbi:MAG TPA: CpsD/CapB family tyrosine-protein kinase [Anaeromyxobacteraceae bacterium]|nr:CpsD/CapB family tyrosine-protein kinase [Anaeromyxobacteraceae bacterium]